MADPSRAPFIVIVPQDGMGTAERELRQLMLEKYFSLLLETLPLPGAVFFYTEGVKLLVEGSSILDQLRTLEERGVLLIGCSTCLRHFDLTRKIEVGIVGSMGDLLEAQALAEKVIYL